MKKNQVTLCVDSVPTTALVDTGAAISVMSLSFKRRLGHKVMFSWDRSAQLRGVGGEALRPIGICAVTISIGGRTFRTELTVLERTTHDVILGIDFLRECGATVELGRFIFRLEFRLILRMVVTTLSAVSFALQRTHSYLPCQPHSF